MTTPVLRIGGLRLRVTGVSAVQARRLGELVAARLAEQPRNEIGPRRIDAMRLRVRSRATASIEELSVQIADRLRREIK